MPLIKLDDIKSLIQKIRQTLNCHSRRVVPILTTGLLFISLPPAASIAAPLAADQAGDDVLIIEDTPTGNEQDILIIEDDEIVAKTIERVLRGDEFKVSVANSGVEGLQLARRNVPKLVILDVIMPGKDGWTVIHELQSDPETRQIPIIICSIIGETDKALSMGVANYLLKPISEQALLEVLTRLEQPETGGYVLVVDDNPDDRKLLHRILENAGYRVQSADGGVTAIEKISEKPPFLVVLDLMMPDVDGFAVLEMLKGNKATRSIPVVVVTAKELSLVDQERLNQRVQALLQKGLFDQQQLLVDVSTALERLNYKRSSKP